MGKFLLSCYGLALFNKRLQVYSDASSYDWFLSAGVHTLPEATSFTFCSGTLVFEKPEDRGET